MFVCESIDESHSPSAAYSSSHAFVETQSVLLAYARQERSSQELNREFSRLRFSLKQFIADSSNRLASRNELAIAYWHLGQLFTISGNNTDALLSLTEGLRIAEELRDSELTSYYTNVLFANGRLLVPRYSKLSPNYEQQVKEIYQSQLPDWQMSKRASYTRTGDQLSAIDPRPLF